MSVRNVNGEGVCKHECIVSCEKKVLEVKEENEKPRRWSFCYWRAPVQVLQTNQIPSLHPPGYLLK